MNCPDCVNVLTREKMDGTIDNICMLDNRSVFGIKSCNRFKASEIAIQIEPEKIMERLDQFKNKEFYGKSIMEDMNPLTPEELNKKEEKKRRGWPKGKKRQI